MQTDTSQELVSYDEHGVLELHDPQLLGAVSAGLKLSFSTGAKSKNGIFDSEIDQSCVDSTSTNHNVCVVVDPNTACGSDIDCAGGTVNGGC